MSRQFLLVTVVRPLLATLLCLSGAAAIGQVQTTDAEKVRDISPDGEFAMCVRYNAEVNRKLIEDEKTNADQIFSEAVNAVELVALPTKEVVVKLLGERADGTNYNDIALIWSSDSKWFAFYSSEPHVGYTRVYHERGGKFVSMIEPEELRIDVKRDFRAERIRPLRWRKPGVLLLEQFDFGRDDEVTFQFAARFDAEGKFRVINKKKIRPEAK
jgi:hypothetical protein